MAGNDDAEVPAASGGEAATAPVAARAVTPAAVLRTVVVPGAAPGGGAPVGVPHTEADDGGTVLPTLPPLAPVATDVQHPSAVGSLADGRGGRPTPSPSDGGSPSPPGDTAVRMLNREEPTIVAAMNDENTIP